MTTVQDTQQPTMAPTPPPITDGPPPDEVSPSDVISETTPTEGSTDATRKHKRRSGNSVDLTYRYHEPSDDELSWTEDEHGTRRRRKSRKRKSGGGDDFKTGIVYALIRKRY